MAKKNKKKTFKGQTKGERLYEYLLLKATEFSEDLKLKATETEKLFYKILQELGYRFEFQVPIIIDKKHLYIVDFLLVDYPIFCELDGWQHNTPIGLKKDKTRSRHLLKEGLHPLRLTNKQAKTYSKETIKQIIETKIGMLNSVNKHTTKL